MYVWPLLLKDCESLHIKPPCLSEKNHGFNGVYWSWTWWNWSHCWQYEKNYHFSAQRLKMLSSKVLLSNSTRKYKKSKTEALQRGFSYSIGYNGKEVCWIQKMLPYFHASDHFLYGKAEQLQFPSRECALQKKNLRACAVSFFFIHRRRNAERYDVIFVQMFFTGDEWKWYGGQ